MNITEVERFSYKPGDRFLLHTREYAVGEQQAREIISRFRSGMRLPEATPVVVLDGDWQVLIVEDTEYTEQHPEWDACR